MQIRNIAIIAHVDHGKTTLTDALMKQTGMVEDGFSMDINALEKERGITIYAKHAAKPDEAHEKVLELFMDLGANDEQLDFKTIDGNGRAGIAKLNMNDKSKDLSPLLDLILKEVPPAPSDASAPLRFQPFNLAYDNFLGRLGIGRIWFGTIKVGDSVFIKKNTGPTDQVETRSWKITKLFTFQGTERKETDKAEAGDIVMIAGLPDIYIGETVCASPDTKPLSAISVDEPTISLNFLVNDSPFAGRDGKFVTSRQLKERLERELEVNIGLKIDFSSNDSYKV